MFSFRIICKISVLFPLTGRCILMSFISTQHHVRSVTLLEANIRISGLPSSDRDILHHSANIWPSHIIISIIYLSANIIYKKKLFIKVKMTINIVNVSQNANWEMSKSLKIKSCLFSVDLKKYHLDKRACKWAADKKMK